MKPLTISTGRPADGQDKYFQRENIERKIWAKIKQKENLLLAAPRRTGKSSILKNMERRSPDGYIIKYKSVQSVDSINEYFKQIYKLLLENDAVFSFYERHYKKAKGSLKRFISKIKGISIEGITIDPDEHVDYFDECEILLKSLPENFDSLILLIDEFPDAVRNIAILDTKEAIRFLQLNRDLRQEYSEKNLQFVYSGSIGLGNVVDKLNRRDLINDITNIEVNPLSPEEAKELIIRLALGTETKGFSVEESVQDHILQKDSWLIPYYIQIIMDELHDSYSDTGQKVSEKSVDKVITKIIQDRYKYQDYFENWKTRLKQAFANEEYSLALDILNHISIKGVMAYDVMFDLSVKHGVKDIKAITNVLEYDGYTHKTTEKIYKFNSIILKEWWYLNVAN